MKTKLHPIQIDSSNPFANDKLNRKEEIQNLSNIILNIETPTTIGLSSEWGTGKTTYIKMWLEHLKGQGVIGLYFNAWQTDFSGDPLTAFIGEISEGLQELTTSSEEARAAWTATKTAAGYLIKRGIPALVKLGTANLVDVDAISDLVSDISEDALELYNAQKNAAAKFKESVRTLIEENEESSRLVIFVDELDRCRPDYAIELLERIKHLFDIDGVIFVIAMDKDQLCHSIKAIYGNDFDASVYLRRFIDLDYSLSRPDLSSYIDVIYESLELASYFDAEKRTQSRELHYEKENLLNCIKFLAAVLNYSLRDAEQLMTRLKLCLLSAPPNHYTYPSLLAFLLILRDQDRGIYNRYTSKAYGENEAAQYLHDLVPQEQRWQSFECILIEGFLIAGKADFHQETSPLKIEHTETSQNEGAPEPSRTYSRRVVEIAERPAEFGRGVALDFLVSRINLAAGFTAE